MRAHRTDENDGATRNDAFFRQQGAGKKERCVHVDREHLFQVLLVDHPEGHQLGDSSRVHHPMQLSGCRCNARKVILVLQIGSHGQMSLAGQGCRGRFQPRGVAAGKHHRGAHLRAADRDLPTDA